MFSLFKGPQISQIKIPVFMVPKGKVTQAERSLLTSFKYFYRYELVL